MIDAKAYLKNELEATFARGRIAFCPYGKKQSIKENEASLR